MDISEVDRPSKRQKISDSDGEEAQNAVEQSVAASGALAALDTDKTGRDRDEDENGDEEASKERVIGVELFVSPSRESNSSLGTGPLFRGTLKKRYTDFIVNEIQLDGNVLRLQELKPRKLQPSIVAQSNRGSHPPAERSRPDGKAAMEGSPNVRDVTNLAESTEEHPVTTNTNGAGAEVPLSDEISSADKALLDSYLGEPTASKLISLFYRINAHNTSDARARDRLGTVQATFHLDRDTRTRVHESVRAIFSSRIESFTDEDGILSFSASRHANSAGRDPAKGKKDRNQQQRPKQSWSERGGAYLHFSIYKENKDTMEVISYLSRQLHINSKAFAFAGTKDKRAVTVQRASVYKCEAERLAGLNRTLRASAVGDFMYEPQGLSLGDLGGNEFHLSLRDCVFDANQSFHKISERRNHAQAIVERAMQNLRERGFLNYYGLQRFGTFASGTDVVGVKLLQGDFQGAVDAILQYNPDALAEASAVEQQSGSNHRISRDDHDRASAIALFRSTGSSHRALQKLPRKFSAESNVIRHLAKSPRDFAGALQVIPRNLRLMYVHAYQSLVWNNAASARWTAFGDRVVEGDLVLVHEHRDKEIKTLNASSLETAADAEGEAVVLPTADDRAKTADDTFERARPLSVAEAASGAYNIFDVVLPLPGYDVQYPANEALAGWYREFMGKEKLDPFDMRRKQRDFSLSGGYRKLLARIGDGWQAIVKAYGEQGEDEQFVETDLERIRKHENPAVDDVGKKSSQRSDEPKDAEEVAAADKLAIILRFGLGASQYATMALRELSKGGIVAHKAEYSGGR